LTQKRLEAALLVRSEKFGVWSTMKNRLIYSGICVNYKQIARFTTLITSIMNSAKISIENISPRVTKRKYDKLLELLETDSQDMM
jgi:hypothetical protein